MRGLALALCLCAAGCSDATTTGGGGGGASAACAAHERATPDGCVPAGVSTCAEGFRSDESGGCEPILPAEGCPDGLIALPGDTACRPLADCGAERWGHIPLEPGAIHVDQSAPAGGDGSAAAPFTTLLAAVAAVPNGGQIAITDGTYVGDVDIAGKAVRLWGRCPERVTLVGDGTTGFAVSFTTADGSEVHGVAVTGPAIGLSIADARVLVEGVWIHDTGHYGLDVERIAGVTQVELVGVLVERATAAAAFVDASTLLGQDVVLRDTSPTAGGLAGRGLNVQGAPGDTSTAIDRCVIERNHESAVVTLDQPLALSRCVVRDTEVQPSTGTEGRGINVQGGALQLSGSVVSNHLEHGVLVAEGGQATIEDSLIRGIQSSASGRHGSGLSVQRSSTAVVRRSLLADNRDFGAVLFDGAVTLSASIVRDTAPAADGNFGDGVTAARAQQDTTMEVLFSIVERSARAGIASFGATVRVGDTDLRCNPFHLNGEDSAQPFSFEDLGGNTCSCDGELSDCKVLSAGLEPPQAP